MNDTATSQAPRAPVVYFIDDSATMREVIKIAFRKENISVIACADAASAIVQFAHTPPDAIITDVIMPDKDGYEVCQFVKEHPEFSATPVILMSGIVNRVVAEKAMTVKADELIRKPFQPQDLIARVRKLLNPRASVNGAEEPSELTQRIPSSALSNLFAPKPAPGRAFSPATAPASISRTAALTEPPAPRPNPVFQSPTVTARLPATPAVTPPPEVMKLRNEVRRLELLVKKLQAELEAERQYCAALESQLQTTPQAE